MRHRPFLFAVFLIACGISTSSLVLAAEIINVNYKYKIAFTDLTENELKAGDMVMVTVNDGSKVRLKVVDTFPVMAKLAIPDGEEGKMDQVFAAITVGNAVSVRDGARKSQIMPLPAQPKKAEAVDTEERAPSGVESYSPGRGLQPAVREEPARARPAAALPEQAAAVPVVEDGKLAAMEQRLDQMMENNIRLTESVTRLLAEKNAAEALAQQKSAEALAARKKAEELSAGEADLVARNKSLEAAKVSLEQEKLAAKKEIDGLNIKLAELKKKLARMVEIVNMNMHEIKAYEKQ